MIRSGVRILEPAYGPCMGLGQTPLSGGVTLRTFNRNFEGCCGTPDAQIYLVSPEEAAASAHTGVLTDPRTFKNRPRIHVSEYLGKADDLNDDMIVPPGQNSYEVEIIRGPNLQNADLTGSVPENFKGKVLLKTGDIATDDIIVAGAKGVPLRSNIPRVSDLVFETIDPTFTKKDRELTLRMGVIVAGENYGQGSARDHATFCPRYLGIQVLLAKAFCQNSCQQFNQFWNYSTSSE